VAKVIEQGGYRASRTRMDLPVSKAIIGVMKGAEGDVYCSTLGGAFQCTYSKIWIAVGGLPIVNYDITSTARTRI